MSDAGARRGGSCRTYRVPTCTTFVQRDSLAALNSACVLIVDDDASIREALEQFLADEGYTVRVARDGREALALCGSPPLPDLILLDLSMPMMDGHEFARRQQANPALAAIPVCIMTAAMSWSPIPSASASLRKPMSADDLLNVVRHFCR